MSPLVDPWDAGKMVKIMTKRNDLIKFLALINLLGQIFSHWPSILAKWVISDHFDPVLDPWGARKWVKICRMTKLNASIEFLA